MGKADNLPLFYLVLPPKYIEEGVKELVPSLSEKSEYEKKLFSYFIASLSSQISFLKLERRLNPALREKITYFENAIQKIARS